MSYLRYAARIYNCPLLIASEKARVLEQVIRAHEEGRASLLSPATVRAPRHELSAKPGVTRADAGYFRTAEGIGIVQVLGTLVQRSADEDLDAFSGLMAYSSLSRQVDAAASDPRIDAILLEFDSDGGEVAGLIDAAGSIRAAAKKKPVWAIANERALSAGYWAASGATKFFAAQTALVGSIGARILHRDESQRDAKQGYVYTEFVSRSRKADFTPHAPLSDSAKAFAQESVDDLGATFESAVSENRGVDEEIVASTNAGLLNPAAALALGLIDGVQSFDETLAQLAAEAQHVRIYGMRAPSKTRASAPALPDLSLSEGVDTMAAQDTNATAAQIAEAEVRGQAKAEQDYAKKLTDAQTKAAADASIAAQGRIAAILTHAEATGRGSLAQHLAFKTTSSVEDAVAILAASPKEGAGPNESQFAEYMKTIGNGKIVPDAAAGKTDAKVPSIPVAANIFAFRKECVAKARAGK